MKTSGLKKFLPSRDYPYMNARVSAKGAKLLDRQEYEQLLKMESNEIARKLEEGEYEREINELGSHLEGTQLIEAALRNNMYREMRHLVEISPNGLKEIIETYIRRIDVTTYKRIIRWKKSNEKEDIAAVIGPGYQLDMEKIRELSEKTLEEIINQIQFEGSKDYTSEMDASDTVEELENALDTAYFEELLAKADSIGNSSFKQFVRSELEYENLRTVLRLKSHGVDEEEIRSRLIKVEISDLVEECIEAEDLEEAVERLQDSNWEIEDGSLQNVELQLQIARRRKARKAMIKESMGLTSVIAYIIAKIVEVDNLRMIVQAKSTDTESEDEVRENLVIE